MDDHEKTKATLLAEIQALRDRLHTSEATLQAIMHGEVDALVVTTEKGAQVFTLQSADASYRLLVEQMQQGAVLLSTDGLILYGNKSFSNLLGQPLENLIGSSFAQLVSPQDALLFQAWVNQAQQGDLHTLELFLIAASGLEIPVYLSISHLTLNNVVINCLVVTNLTEQKRHEKTLASERLARLILEQAGEAILVCNHSGTIIHASQVASHFWGKNLISQPFDSLSLYLASAPLPPAIQLTQQASESPQPKQPQPKVYFQIATVLNGASMQGVEVEVTTPQGRVLNLMLNARPLADMDNHFRGAVVILTDMTQRKQVETALRQSQLQLQQQLAEIETIYQCAPIGLNVIDPELRFVRINRRLADMNGLSIEAHLGHTIREVLPDLADAAEALLQQILVTGEPLLNVEITGKTPASPGIQRTWLESFWPIKNGDRVIGINTVCEEITDRKRLEADRQRAEAELRRTKDELELRVAERTVELRRINVELQQSESILRSFFNSGGTMMAILEMDGEAIRYISTNCAIADFWGTTPDTLKHQLVSQFATSPDQSNLLLQYCREAQTRQSPISFEYRHQPVADRDRQQPCWLTVSICPIAVTSSGHPQFAFIAQDISDLKQAEQNIAASLREKEVLLKEIHHRVKNSLAIVSGLLQMQARRTIDRDAHTILRDSQNRIASIALVHEKLYRSGDLANIDIAQYIKDLTIYLFDSYNISSDQIRLSVYVDPVCLDIETIIPYGLVINELVSNALKHAFPGDRRGEIQVRFSQSVSSQDPHHTVLTLVVHDNGVGFPPDFDLQQTRTLGLNLVQGLVRQIGASFEIRNQQGTEFKIVLIKPLA